MNMPLQVCEFLAQRKFYFFEVGLSISNSNSIGNSISNSNSIGNIGNLVVNTFTGLLKSLCTKA